MLGSLAGEVLSTRNILFGVTIALLCKILIGHLQWLLTSHGPWGVPFLGYYPFLKGDFYIHLRDLSKKYGDAFTINLAGQTFLYLNNLKAVKEAHVNQVENFPGRSSKHGILQSCFEDGLLYLRGDQWRHLRKFFSQSMRDVGLGPHKEELKGPIGDSIRAVINTLKESEGQPVDFSSLIAVECAKAVSLLVLGDDVSEEDQAIISEGYRKMVQPMGDVNTLLIGNIAKYLILPRVPGYSDMLNGKKEMATVIRNIIKTHRERFDSNQTPRDLIDIYLREVHMRQKKEDPSLKYFNDKFMLPNLMIAYGDGSVGNAAFFASFLRDLSQHPDAQDKIYEEIVNVVGTERQPVWEDRKDLPLTVSAIKELFRVTLFFPVYPSLECNKNTTVLGVKVPKGCTTLVNNWALHHDPTLYKNPDKFDITRFLPGKDKEDDPYTFGVGKRACAGELFTMTETFLFLSSLLQNFKFLPSNAAAVESGSPYAEAAQFRLRALPRSAN